MRVPRELPRAIDPEDAHVRALSVAFVAAARLSERLIRPGDVQDVVHDLEQDPKFGGKAP